MRRVGLGQLLATIGAVALTSSAGAAIDFEIYNSRVAFESRLRGDVRVIDFDDVDTSSIDPRSFAADRYASSTGAIVEGATSQGQYASQSFGFVEFSPTSAPNIYAPGPISVVVGTNTTTQVTFTSGGGPGRVAGFGAVFIDTDFPGLGPSSLSVFDENEQFLSTTGTISGSDGSQLFRGVVAVDDQTDFPVRVIGLVELVSGNAWPTVDTFDSEGVVLDDFVFHSVPEPVEDLMPAAAFAVLGVLAARRRRGTGGGNRGAYETRRIRGGVSPPPHRYAATPDASASPSTPQ